MSMLSAQHISVNVDGRTVVADASLSVGTGEVAVLMGHNGSGKSSFAQALFGHPKYPIAGGVLTLDGEDITHISPEGKAQRGMFLSLQHLPKFEGITLVKFLYEALKKRVPDAESFPQFYRDSKALAEGAGISPDLLDRPLHAGLSGGEKKQAELLQLLVLRPQIAVLDEIDSGVDVSAIKKVFAGIKRMAEDGTGFLLVTHYTRLAEHITPDRVYVMKEGKIVKEGGAEIIAEIEREGF